MTLSTLFRILRARWFTIVGITFLALLITGLATMYMPRVYTATNELIVDAKAQDPISGQLLSSRLLTGYMATQEDIIRSRSVADQVIIDESLSQEPSLLVQFKNTYDGDEVSHAWLLAYLGSGLKVAPKRDSGVLGVSFSASNPELAARLANAFAAAYIAKNLELRIEPARQINEWYEQQLTALREALVEKQNELAEYQEINGMVASDRVDLESAKLAELSSMLTLAQSARLDSQSRSNQMDTSPRDSLAGEALSNPQIRELSSQLAQAQGRLRELNLRVGSNHPEYRQALAEVDTLNGQLNRTLELVNNSLQSSTELSQTREEQLKSELEAQKDLVLQLSRHRNQQTLLQQEVASAQAAYDAALGRSIQTRMESQIVQTDIAVLNSANVPVLPASPNLKMSLALAGMLGLLLGGALALCREWLDRRVRSAEDLVSQLGLPVLVRIPADRFRWPSPRRARR